MEQICENCGRVYDFPEGIGLATCICRLEEHQMELTRRLPNTEMTWKLDDDEMELLERIRSINDEIDREERLLDSYSGDNND